MKKLILMLVVVLMTSAFLSADVYIKQEVKSSGIPGQEPKSVISEQWINQDKMATVAGDQKTILDFGTKKAYLINLEKKTYVETSIPLDMSKVLPPESLPMMKLVSDGMTATVTPNNKTQKVGNWNCKGYDAVITMKMMGMEMKTNMTVWATTEVLFDLKTFEPMRDEIVKLSMSGGEKVFNEFKKIEGIQIASDINASQMGQTIKVSTNTLEINANKTAPADIYTLPAGFSKKDFIDSPMGK